ncbi:MAG TPA: PQQ-binding-like beta-propeller repeat protein [Bryobacteraceae bacterium]|nr:PQQ-binding-like beta-propeller repeat protein [Bryobacteraceae bacterium]
MAFSTRNGEMLWKQPRKVQVGWSTPLLFQSQLITTSSEATIAYDPRTGKELWRGPGVANTSVPSLVAGHGLVFVSAGYPQKKIIALKTGAGAGQVAWQYDKGPGYVPSPILYGDYLYVISDRGLITCFDARTGKVAYEGGRPPVPATFSSSPVAFNGKLFITSEDADTYVIQAGPEHKVLRTNALGEPVFASIAIGDGALFLRGARNLYCIRASQ